MPLQQITSASRTSRNVTERANDASDLFGMGIMFGVGIMMRELKFTYKREMPRKMATLRSAPIRQIHESA